MDELADIYRPILLKHLEQANPETQTLLRLAVARALGGIESICPVAMVPTAHGMVTAYGPSDEAARQPLLVLVATPRRCTVLGADAWPSPVAPPTNCTTHHIWNELARAVEENKQDTIATLLALRFTREVIAAYRKEAKAHRKRGNVPLLLLLCAREAAPDEMFRACGLSVVIPLPPSINDQFRSQGG